MYTILDRKFFLQCLHVYPFLLSHGHVAQVETRLLEEQRRVSVYLHESTQDEVRLHARMIFVGGPVEMLTGGFWS